MTTPTTLDGLLVQWGDRLFYPGNRIVRSPPAVRGGGIGRAPVGAPSPVAPAERVGGQTGLPKDEPAPPLVDDRHFDNLSGQQAYKCFACRVVRA